MAKNKPRLYIDACCYIDVVKGRLTTATDADTLAELPFLEGLLRAAADGELEIWGSTLLIAECLTTDTQADSVPLEAQQLFRSLLTGGNPVKMAAADVFIAERARDLRWNAGIRCGGGADALHVATALDLGCEEFITTNRKRGPLQGDTPAKLAKLHLRVIRPHQTALLPPAYMKPLDSLWGPQ
jgi:hypothetical protein